MSVLRLLLNGSYRSARRAEGAGQYRRAAALYAEADAPEDAANALLLHAARSEILEDRIAAWRDALRWLPADHPRRAEVQTRIGRTVLEDARLRGVLGRADRERVTDAARRLERAGQWRDAAAAWELLEATDEVARCLEQAGDVERLERLLETRGAREGRERRVRKLVNDYEMDMRTGARLDARRALREALGETPEDESLVQTLRRLEARLPEPGRVELDVDGRRILIVARTPAVVGRADADVALRGASVSRRHTALEREGDELVIRDLGSRNGTHVEGVPVEGELRAHGPTRIGLGDDVLLEVTPASKASVHLVVDRGIDRGWEVWIGEPVESPAELPARFTFPEGQATVTGHPGCEVWLSSQRCVAPVTLLEGDVLTVGDRRVEVRG